MPISDCRGCGESFSGVGPFDAHHKDMPKHPFTKCLPPADVGLVRDKHGRWGGADTYVPASERSALDYERECVTCGTMFERPRRRGRPPTKCERCR